MIGAPALADGRVIAEDRHPCETGGILLGWREECCIHVDRLIEVYDPNAERTTYARNHSEAQVALKLALTDLSPESFNGYVGEWHTHPSPQGPSTQDRKEIRAVARLAAGPVAMLVFVRSNTGEWVPRAMAASGRAIQDAAIRTEEV